MGRRIQRLKVDGNGLLVARNAFRFPSNGKAYPKNLQITMKSGKKVFPFPSSGKAYPKEHRHCRLDCRRSSFDSLRTGKRIQRSITISTRAGNSCVSIPFKRESVSKEVTMRFDGDDIEVSVSIPFQRESVSKG